MRGPVTTTVTSDRRMLVNAPQLEVDLTTTQKCTVCEYPRVGLPSVGRCPESGFVFRANARLLRMGRAPGRIHTALVSVFALYIGLSFVTAWFLTLWWEVTADLAILAAIGARFASVRRNCNRFLVVTDRELE